MSSLANLATKCRFAVLEVSDDDDEGEEAGQNKSKTGAQNKKNGNTTKQDSDGTAKSTKKKSKRKKHKSKGNPVRIRRLFFHEFGMALCASQSVNTVQYV